MRWLRVPIRPRLRHLTVVGSVATLLTAAALVFAPSAQAITASPLVGQASGKCLDVSGNTSADGAQIIIWTCHGGGNQAWTSTATGELQVTVGGATKCLDAAGHGTANGTKVETWACTGGANQKWTLAANGTIVGNESGKCLDVTGNATANGTTVNLWTCHNGGNQIFTPGTGTPPPPPPTGGAKAAPYLHMGWGSPPTPSTVMSATGIKWFTMAFINAAGGCSPAWDSTRPLQGSADSQAIANIRGSGGDVIPSFGGWQGNKLGPNCSTPQALANAYIQVIDAYGLKAIDIDVENTDELENATVQDRILGALKIVKQSRSVQTIVTIGTTTTGPGYWGNRLITQGAALAANVDVWTIMPFDFGGGANMYQNTVNASEGLKSQLKTAFGWSDATAYTHMGISGMNGLSDQQELTSPATWQQIRDWAAARHLARFAFWSVNRDRPCAGGGVVSWCSGIAQNDWQFTSITAGYSG